MINFTKELIKSASYCNFCPKMCRFVCPPAEVMKDEAFVPTLKVGALWEIMQGFVKNKDCARYSFTGCVMCFACKNYCYHKIDVDELMAKGREIILKENPYEGSLRIIENILSTGNYFGEKFETGGLQRSEENKILLHPGCFVLKYEKELLKDYSELFIYHGLKNVNFPDENEMLCCGYPLFALGDFESFSKNAQNLIKTFNRYSLIVALCPHCAYIMKNKYKKLFSGVKFNVMTSVEFISSYISFVPGKILRELFIYHDPCYLSRGLGIWKEPRELLWRAVEEIHEFKWSREETECCGGGGLVPEINPPLSREIAKNRLRDVREEYEIVTPCPHCRKIFTEEKRKTSDIVEILMRSLR